MVVLLAYHGESLSLLLLAPFVDQHTIPVKINYEQTIIQNSKMQDILKKYIQLQSNLYQEVTFGKRKTWPCKTGDLLKEVQII